MRQTREYKTRRPARPTPSAWDELTPRGTSQPDPEVRRILGLIDETLRDATRRWTEEDAR